MDKYANSTKIATNRDKIIKALLGASPSASTAVSIMLNILKECFPDEIKSKLWQKKLSTMIPSYGKSLHEDEAFCLATRARTAAILKLEDTG